MVVKNEDLIKTRKHVNEKPKIKKIVGHNLSQIHLHHNK